MEKGTVYILDSDTSPDELKELVLANMQGMADLYTEQANTQALQLDTMQGLADLYALQTEGGV